MIAAAGLTGGTLGLVGAGTAAESLSASTVLAVLQVLAGAFFVRGAVRGRRPPAPAAAGDPATASPAHPDGPAPGP
ncbi:hypothetical protein [Streptomyces sp. NPDC015350]|uniref:hypothetical protein n=1 Tax=Streptomyces sp. NPDC015350 TaxID=3364955 RepID=UPI0036FDB568